MLQPHSRGYFIESCAPDEDLCTTDLVLGLASRVASLNHDLDGLASGSGVAAGPFCSGSRGPWLRQAIALSVAHDPLSLLLLVHYRNTEY